jgi:hypothetical protein
LEVILGLIQLVGILELDAFSTSALTHVEDIDNKMISPHKSQPAFTSFPSPTPRTSPKSKITHP